MDTNKGEIRVYVMEDNVGLKTENDFCSITPRVAVELAQSLMLCAMEVDPDMDAELVVEEYLASRLKAGVH